MKANFAEGKLHRLSMLTFDVITIFPEIFNSYLKESLLYRAQKKRLIKINIHNLRKWTTDRHKTVDDRPYGGGLGMVMKVEPIYRAVRDLRKPASAKASAGKAKIVLFTPRGRQFTQQLAYSFSKLNHLILICGRYEGVDERVAKHIANMELSVGPYDLMGGELPAMVLMETVARLIPGVLGKPELLKERITKEKGFIEYPQYTRPDMFKPKKGTKWGVPKVLLSGHHKKIAEWRKKRQKAIE